MSESSYAKCACASCGTHIEYPLDAAGAVVNCPGCEQAMTLPQIVPAPASATSTTPPGSGQDRPISASELLSAFNGTVSKTPVSILYQLGLVVVAITMIILPLIYFALIGLAGWGVYYWATHFTWLMSGGGGRVMILKFLAYATPLFVGVILVLFMIKPLFAKRSARAQPLAVNPDSEPVLFAFIHRICEIIGAPKPKRIDIDCQLNASAGFRRGLWSLLGNDLVLTIGMPLVAGLNTRQLAGVIAHEFGHFTQGFGMRLTYLIRSINAWFFRVVYERDQMDVSLDEWAEECEDWRILIIANIARIAVWGSRRVLWLLMMFGHLIGCFMLRQMEYDADSYEIKLSGSDDFESTSRRMHVLGEILGETYKGLRTGFTLSKNLPDNFPAHLMHQDEAFPESRRNKLEDTMGLEATGLFDTHPSNGDRIRRARQAGLPGIFHLEVPSKRLFENFEIVSKQVTMLHYEDDLGLPLEAVHLKPVDHWLPKPEPEPQADPQASQRAEAMARSPIKLKSHAQG